MSNERYSILQSHNTPPAITNRMHLNTYTSLRQPTDASNRPSIKTVLVFSMSLLITVRYVPKPPPSPTPPGEQAQKPHSAPPYSPDIAGPESVLPILPCARDRLLNPHQTNAINPISNGIPNPSPIPNPNFIASLVPPPVLLADTVSL